MYEYHPTEIATKSYLSGWVKGHATLQIKGLDIIQHIIMKVVYARVSSINSSQDTGLDTQYSNFKKARV